MKILVCNSGSSSLKVSLFEAGNELLLAQGSIDWTTRPTRLVFRRAGQPEIREELELREHSEALGRILADLQAEPSPALNGVQEIEAVGHRVVHGGQRFTAAVRITPEVQEAIGELSELAPLHNPASQEAIWAIERVLPEVPQVAVFDTTFHSTLPAFARTYAIPRAWTTEWGIHRYGFHGLSHDYCAGRAAEMLGLEGSRLIIAHLGNGASVSAVRGGICLDTSMGFTPVEGIVMGTRSGSLDPGVLLYLLRHKGLTVEQIDHALNYESGLLGLSGISSDMREILAKAANNPGARLALQVYIHRLVQTIGAMAATLGGVDGLVFTAGVGENSAQIRELVCENLGHLGLSLDTAANARCKPDAYIASPGSRGRVLVISTREDLTILRETSQLIRSEAQSKSDAASEFHELKILMS
ncbi:MAG: acetate/propionate family kinase [Candidatus Dormibacteraceae bacterium]